MIPWQLMIKMLSLVSSRTLTSTRTWVTSDSGIKDQLVLAALMETATYQEELAEVIG